jgi:hypothetical protein
MVFLSEPLVLIKNDATFLDRRCADRCFFLTAGGIAATAKGVE